MKLTRERLKQIIREELEEMRFPRGEYDDERTIRGWAMPQGTGTSTTQFSEMQPIATQIEKYVANKRLSESDPNVKSLRTLRNLLNADSDATKKYYETVLGGQEGIKKVISLIDDSDLKSKVETALGIKPNIPVQERKKK